DRLPDRAERHRPDSGRPAARALQDVDAAGHRGGAAGGTGRPGDGGTRDRRASRGTHAGAGHAARPDPAGRPYPRPLPVAGRRLLTADSLGPRPRPLPWWTERLTEGGVVQFTAGTTALYAGTLDDQVAARLLYQRIIVLGQEVDDQVANRL